MQKIKQVSFFNNTEHWNPKEKIWKPFQQTKYQVDIIELKFKCYYLKMGIQKPIDLEIGQKCLYNSKQGIHSGYLSLNFTIMTCTNYEGQIILCLEKNNNRLDLIIENIDQVKEVLKKKCIQTSFHEHFLLQKNIADGNKKAKVFLVMRKTTNEFLVAKAYSKEYLSKFLEGRRILKNEIKALRILNSEHVIALREVHESENSIYLIMDYVTGGQLSDKMANSLITQENVQILMYNFFKGLYQIHQKNIILRNIAPDNILFRNESFVNLVIIGFGQVQLKGSNQEKPFANSEFMAPELLENKTIDSKCDIYSAGVILYKLIVQDENIQTTNKGQFSFSAKQFLQAPKSLQSLIKKMLRVDPKSRYNTEKCLQHRYFSKIFSENDIFQTREFSPQSKCSKQDLQTPISMRSLDADFQIDPLQDFHKFESQSLRNSPICKSTQAIPFYNNDDVKKQQVKQSKFSKFCSDMQENYKPQNNKKALDESLFKLAVTNSYFQSESKNEIRQTKQQGGRIGLIKKSNSLNI